jgi:hypothetical protein
MTNLSPAAQSVLDAFLNRSLTSRQWYGDMGPQLKLAAALRAAIDQVVPEYRENRPKTFDEKHRKMDASVIRYCLLDIADELEAQ